MIVLVYHKAPKAFCKVKGGFRQFALDKWHDSP